MTVPTRADRALARADRFADRHIGPSPEEIRAMLDAVGVASLDELADAVVPPAIRYDGELDLPAARGEGELLTRLRRLVGRNRVCRSLIGLGYHESVTPPVIQRNVLENPGWYTQYTPYQAEIAQGRLEALLNFQTMVADLTGLPLANASLLDEATAAAEAMVMCRAASRNKQGAFYVADDCHPQTTAVVETRARAQGIDIEVGPAAALDAAGGRYCGVLLQYPNTHGEVFDHATPIAAAHDAGALVVVATDLLALTLLRCPGEMGADIAVGSTQRFGVPLGFGGPHAAFMAASQALERHLPGRIVGVSVDASGGRALRLARQTREQHIRRERATSNICTAQVLLAVIAGMYAVYHGPGGLRRIAEQVQAATLVLAAGLRAMGRAVTADHFFGAVRVPLEAPEAERIAAAALEHDINLRRYDDGALGVAFDERCDVEELGTLLSCFTTDRAAPAVEELARATAVEYPPELTRESPYLTNEVFNRYHSEHELLRYLHRLQERDLSLTHSMIPLGSCTMKLNATAEMLPITWPELARIHPFAPRDQVGGYIELITDLERWLAEITGFAATSLQPNAGSQGELCGLLVARAYHAARGEAHRDVCLIPTSAHGTNPASAVMAGLRVVPVACDERGDIDLDDLAAKASEHGDRLAALMITYPSTHGVFEEGVRRVCEIVHDAGGQVYLDGANMNAQVGLCRPGDLGADVCHLNLHKTFCIPHGGGGPGVGPICVASHLAPHLPGHPLWDVGGDEAIGPVAAAPYGSAGILPITWMYIALMGAEGLRAASQVAILNANYMARRLAPYYPILYTGRSGRVAHEFIIDLRDFKQSVGVTVDDVAKRLIDYGFHAPTMSWPVAGTMMIEPTESESQEEMDRLCDAMIAIRGEIDRVAAGELPLERSPLRLAPHSAATLASEDWDRPYPRALGVFPAPWVSERKFWPPVERIDNAFGDRNLVCTCDSVEAYALDSGNG